MTRRFAWLAGLLLLAAGCSGPYPITSSNPGPSVRCMDPPGRGENYGQERPMFYVLCVQSP